MSTEAHVKSGSCQTPRRLCKGFQANLGDVEQQEPFASCWRANHLSSDSMVAMTLTKNENLSVRNIHLGRVPQNLVELWTSFHPTRKCLCWNLISHLSLHTDCLCVLECTSTGFHNSDHLVGNLALALLVRQHRRDIISETGVVIGIANLHSLSPLQPSH